jgi:hypothetical protein
MIGNGSEPAARQSADEWFTPGRFAALLAVLVGAAYPEVLFGQGTFFHRDFAVFGYPLAYYHRESFWRGEIPLWNPLNYCGLPFLAQWNTLALYPLSLIYLLFPLSWSLGIFCLAHFFLAGMGMYFLAYRWTGNRFAAAAAGLVFSFNALMLNCLMWPNNIAAMGWLPWVVLATEHAWRTGKRWLLAAALAGAMQMLSGAPEVIFLTWVLLAALFAGEMVRAPASRWRMSARFLTVGLWVAGLAAAQLLPFLDLLAHSQRDKAFVGSMWSMPAWGWANFLVPLYRSYPTPLGSYAQPDQYWIPSYYLGVGVVALALLAVGLVRRPLVWLLGTLTALCLLLALGDHGLVYSALRKALPSLGFMRYPIKFVILPTVLVPLLAAIFLARCPTVPPDDWPHQRRRIVGLGIALLAIIGVLIWSAFQYPLHGASAQVAAQSGAIRAGFLIMILGGIVALRQISRHPLDKLARFALLFLLWLDALTAGPRPNPSAPRWVYEPNLARKELRLAPAPRIGESRTMLNAEAEANLTIAPMTNAVNQVLYFRLALYGNANLLDHIPKVAGMYSLFLRESGDVFSTLFGAPQPPAGLADFLAVSHINTPGKVTEWDFRPTYLPWVTAGQKPVFADPAGTLNALAAPDFDPRRTVFLPLETRALITVSNSSPAKISVQEFSAHKVKLETEASEPALVVIAQSFYHNWRAYVAGRPTRLLRANHAFQALEIPAGRQQVTLAYEDRAFYCGALISLISAAVWVAFWVRGRKRPFLSVRVRRWLNCSR